jgi:beta-lactamase regulating signal transducer with metallopeptidase domain
MILMTALRVGVLLAVALAVLPLLRRRSAAVRAWVLTAALAGATLLPVLQLIAPAWGSALAADTQLGEADTWFRLLAGVWAAGTAAHLLLLVVGIVRLMGIAAAANPIRDGRCADLALDISADYRVHAPVLLLEADRATLPVTWGHAQPKILLPPSARGWSDERIRAVLCHEIAHVRRRDWLVQVFATVVRALYWPHPLVWIACARLRLECERACDDAVLRDGIDGSRYASHLLALARSVVEGRQPAPTAALAVRSTLEQRVRSMLSTRCDRSPIRRVPGVLVAAMALIVALGVAGFGHIPAPATTTFIAPPAKRLTLLLDGQIVDLSKEWPSYPNPRAGLVQGPGFPREF